MNYSQYASFFNNLPQFVVFRFVREEGSKTLKPPVHPRTGKPTNVFNPAAWLTCEGATAAAAALGPDYGIGFVLTGEERICCIDIDGVDAILRELPGLLERFPGCAMEVSHSGEGIHLWIKGDTPPHTTRARGLELYSQRRAVAFGSQGLVNAECRTDYTPALTLLVEERFTRADGNAAPSVEEAERDGPVPEWSGPTDDDNLLALALAAPRPVRSSLAGKASFRELWEAEPQALAQAFPSSSGDDFDHSRADAALAAHLAFFTGNDAPRIERMMRRSKLYRGKWDTHSTYLRQRTIGGQIRRTQRWLKWKESPQGVIPFSKSLCGPIPATLPNVIEALCGPESGVLIKHDEFTNRITIDDSLLEDNHLIKLRRDFEVRGFKPIGPQMMSDAVHNAADLNRYDSAIDTLEGFEWDGIPRIETLMRDYFGTTDTPYGRAVGQYFMTALAGRVMSPGCQADMAPIFIGIQGTGKSSAVQALALTDESFNILDLGSIDSKEIARHLQGVTATEIAELRNLRTKESGTVKEFISRRFEKHRPLYGEYESRHPRRNIFFGTTNRDDELSDETGNRRWLPIRTGTIDVAGLARDHDQLWAEALSLWLQHGILWKEAARLVEAEHAQFMEEDPWEQAVSDWLNTLPPNHMFQIVEVLRVPLRHEAHQQDIPTMRRVGKILRKLGYDKSNKRVDGVQGNRWCKIGADGPLF